MGSTSETTTPSVSAGPTVRSVAISPDGSYIVAAGDDGIVRLWDSVGRRRTTLFGLTGPVRSVAFSRDGSLIVAAGDDGTVRLWDASTGTGQKVLIGSKGAVRSVATSPGDSCLASAGDDGTVRLWNVTTGAEQAEFTGSRGVVRSVAFSPDGTLIAAAGDDAVVRLWDASTGSGQKFFIGSKGAVRSVAFSPDGTLLASAGDDGTVRLWNVTTGAEQAELAGSNSPIKSAIFSPDGSFLASAGRDISIRIWDMISREPIALSDIGSAESLAISPDGTWLAAAGVDSDVHAIDLTTREIIRTYSLKPTAFISYAMPDRAAAARLENSLRDAGFSVWTDSLIPIGTSIAGQIENAIRSSDVVFAVSSHASNDSPAVSAELAMAVAARSRDQRKLVIPVISGKDANISPLLQDISGLSLGPADRLTEQLTSLARRVTTQQTTSIISPQRTTEDLEAQYNLLEAERIALEQSRETHGEEQEYRERAYAWNLNLLMVTGFLLAIAGLGTFLIVTNNSTTAAVLTGANMALALVFLYRLRKNSDESSATSSRHASTRREKRR